ncbi:glycine cleavage system protein T [Hypericibacter terrae]|uniref:Glycine cleavage system protein T n=1 Tax=Hypericibacter terrae TaxID=2602015 RepID=A0A5J6MP15_9PROT|nr:FAD-dependent oxidoreductase [Hypericibacter terrae]QEX18365.1 glycine cleavage system protein T [Hypericibacter terrae]
METHARVVIIGGGVVGCSILYHLAKHGLKDAVLLERKELTSGSSWHAAGMIHTINADPNIARLQGYTIKLYNELEDLTGQSCSIHRPGGIYLAATPERLDYLKQERAKARYMGLETDFISLEHARELNPLIDPKKYLGALFEPVDGHVDPSGVTHAYAKGARHYGAKVYRDTPVIETKQRPDGSWDVVTPKGTIRAEIVVNAAGLWAREVGRLAGLELPVQPMEHHYLITETIPEVRDHGKEIAVTVDYEGNAYTRQEHQGVLLGTYETNCVPWAVEGTPLDFGHELLQDDLARVSERLDTAFERMPALGRAGIKKVINGPFTFGPDGNPLIGPVPGLKNYWTAVGVMAGFCQGGGVGLCMAEWIIDGEPSIDVWGMDVARFGSFATRDWGRIKSAENYSRRFILTYPNETLPAGRRQKTTALYDRLIARGAVMGVSFGLEHALWFAGSPDKAKETPTFRRSNAFAHVAEEIKAVRERVGMIEIANYAKHEVSGPGAEAFLDKMLANKLPKEGRLALTPMLTPKGKLYGDLTVARMEKERFYLFGSSAAQEMHRRWFEQHLPEKGVAYHNRTDDLQGIAIAGPSARELLSRLTAADVSAAAFKFRDIKRMVVGLVPALVARVSFSGELGYEIYVAPQYQLRLYEALEEAGKDLGLRTYGGRALMSMRLEKNWGVWTLDYRPDFTAAESGLDAFVAFDKPADFVGKKAALAERKRGPAKKLVTLVVDTQDVDCVADEPIFHDGACVGYVTSGGYAHSVKKSMAMGYVPTALAGHGTKLEVELLGEFYPATVTATPLYDPNGGKMRG